MLKISAKMASKSNIPRYVKTQNPVSSFSYRKVLKTVREKKAEISLKEREIELFKAEADARELEDSPRRVPRVVAEEEPSEDFIASERQGASSETLNLFSKTRTTIVTPGGSKRKGKIKCI